MKVLDTWARWERAGAAALFVVFDEADAVRSALLADLEPATLPFPVLVDRSREAYARWGLRRAPWWRIWLDPGVYRQYWRLWRQGESLRKSGEDPLQLGGDFIVSPDGAIAYARPQQRDDRPAVGELLRVVSAPR